MNRHLLALVAGSALITLRVARRWNQTGQKFAGEPDIGRTFLFEHRAFFWIILCITYLWALQSLASTGFPRFSQLIAGGVSTALATAAVTFKLAFTYADSPELMVGAVTSMAENDVGLSLVLRARIVFIGILITMAYAIVSGFSHTKRANRKSFTLFIESAFLTTFSNNANPARPPVSLPNNPISRNQYPPPPRLRDHPLLPQRTRSFTHRTDNHLPPPPIHILLRLRRLKRHLLRRPIQRLQRRQRLQCARCGHPPLRQQLGRAHLLGFRYESHAAQITEEGREGTGQWGLDVGASEPLDGVYDV